MSIRIRSILLFFISSFLLLSFFSVFIYQRYDNHRKEAFYNLLREKANTAAHLLYNVNEVDGRMLKLIDSNSIYRTRKEKTIITDLNGKIYFESSDAFVIDVSSEVIKEVLANGEKKYVANGVENIAIHFKDAKEDVLVFVAADDIIGDERAAELKKILIIGVFAGCLLIVLLSLFFANYLLKPLRILTQAVTTVNEEKLNQQIDIGKRKDELGKLQDSFNKMLQQLDTAFNNQKLFVQYASHELRTPLNAMMTQIDVALQTPHQPVFYEQLLIEVQKDHQRLKQLIAHLLLLFKSEYNKDLSDEVRIDESILTAIELARKAYPVAKFNFSYETEPEEEEDLIIKANAALLELLWYNLLVNACKYGDAAKLIHIKISLAKEYIEIIFSNSGKLLSETEAQNLFSQYYRASNSNISSGYGLGLMITQKIISLHQASISYNTNNGTNNFVVRFTK